MRIIKQRLTKATLVVHFHNGLVPGAGQTWSLTGMLGQQVIMQSELGSGWSSAFSLFWCPLVSSGFNSCIVGLLYHLHKAIRSASRQSKNVFFLFTCKSKGHNRYLLGIHIFMLQPKHTSK